MKKIFTDREEDPDRSRRSIQERNPRKPTKSGIKAKNATRKRRINAQGVGARRGERTKKREGKSKSALLAFPL